MTGEITLSGLVLPVGGIREKALAARRHGIRTFILPEMNRSDLAELPAEVREDIRFVPVIDARRGAAGRAAGQHARLRGGVADWRGMRIAMIDRSTADLLGMSIYWECGFAVHHQ